MVLKQQRVDITDRVVGKLYEGQMELLVENEPIGRILLNGHGADKFELNQGYEQEQYKIFKFVDVPTGDDKKYVDCEENGWC